jgi:hypothetical protein
VSKSIAGLLTFAILLIGCGGGDNSDTAEPGDLIGILVSPENAIVPVGEEVQMIATGLYDNRMTRDITSAVDWSSSDESTVEVKNDLDSEGVMVGKSSGDATVEAQFDGLRSASVRVTVTSAALVGLSIEPASVSVEAGQSIQLSATAAYTDGTRGDASTQVRWITSDGGVVQISSSGVLSGVANGSADVYVKLGDMESESISVSVVQSAQADLYIANIDLEPGIGDATLNLNIGNKGDGSVSDFWIDIFVDPTYTPSVGDLGELYTGGAYLGAGDMVEGSFQITLSEGSHEIYVILDTDDLVDESNESNNVDSAVVTIGGGETVGPNLTITYFDYLVDSSSIYYFVDITNTGGEDVEGFFVDVYYDESQAPALYTDGQQWVEIESLEAGATTYADFLVDSSEVSAVCSTCKSWVLIDGYDDVSETNESDNTEGPLTVYP